MWLMGDFIQVSKSSCAVQVRHLTKDWILVLGINKLVLLIKLI